jgi:acrylyl-CoA reductase (NADPH)
MMTIIKNVKRDCVKDALALSGRVEVIDRLPLIDGVDLAGLVKISGHPDFEPSERVVVDSRGLRRTHHGG